MVIRNKLKSWRKKMPNSRNFLQIFLAIFVLIISLLILAGPASVARAADKVVTLAGNQPGVIPYSYSIRQKLVSPEPHEVEVAYVLTEDTSLVAWSTDGSQDFEINLTPFVDYIQPGSVQLNIVAYDIFGTESDPSDPSPPVLKGKPQTSIVEKLHQVPASTFTQSQ
jgi:hypothetical protein